MHKYVIDCSELNSEEKFWDAYLECADIEGAKYFGRNTDALWDALNGGGPGYPKEQICIIYLKNTKKLKKIKGGSLYKQLKLISSDFFKNKNININLSIE